MLNLAQQYNKSIVEEATLTPEELKIRHVGKQDPKRHLGDAVEKAMGKQVVQSLGMGVLSEVSISVLRSIVGIAGWLIFGGSDRLRYSCERYS